jgi:hypothetical protein
MTLLFAATTAAEEAAHPAAAPTSRAPSAKRAWIGEACRNEFATLCKDMPNDSRRDAIVACLKQHADSLSHDCAEAIADRDDRASVSQPGRGNGHRGRRGAGGGIGGWPR